MDPNRCPEFLYHGVCTTKECALKHDFKFCTTCGVLCKPGPSFEAHLKGRKHRENIEDDSIPIWLKCSICENRVRGEKEWFKHVQSQSHLAKASALGKSPYDFPLDPTIPSHFRCLICRRSAYIYRRKKHFSSDEHAKMEQAALLQARFEQAEQDRGGVTVSHSEHGIDFGIVDLASAKAGMLTTEVTVDVPGQVSIVRTETLKSGMGTANP